jgi:bisphosphoglycerate-dependent phosphoglycerate mutase
VAASEAKSAHQDRSVSADAAREIQVLLTSMSTYFNLQIYAGLGVGKQVFTTTIKQNLQSLVQRLLQ